MILSKRHYSEKFSSAAGFGKTLQWLQTLNRHYRAWQRRERERRLLAGMGERDFKDFGMTRQHMEFQLESRWAPALRRIC
jgi:uncharacterized protein YjiS (DUF1127 family)